MRQTADQSHISSGKRLAFVTGANRGLGKALCSLLESHGFTVHRIDRNFADLSSSRHELIRLIHQKVPDLLINNAGFGLYGEASILSVQKQLDMIEVNCKAIVELSLEAAKALKLAGKKGTIVNISSAAAFFPFPYFATYAATKGFIHQWSLAVDKELKPYGIRVLSACPGQIATDFRRHASQGLSKEESFWTMSVEKAAACIWKQITQGKQGYIFTWPYRLGVWISKLLPGVASRLLSKNIQKRIQS
jgi:short-subunit dehydrogenase